MILHGVALAFAVGELVLTSVARRGRPHAVAGVVASVAMVAAMADGWVFAPRILPVIGWTAVLLVIAIGMLVESRLRPGPDSAARHPPVEAALGLIVMAFLPLVAGGHAGDGQAAPGTGGHSHEQVGWMFVMLVACVLLGLLVAWAVPLIRSRGGSAGARNAVAARACMLCSLTTMMAAVIH